MPAYRRVSLAPAAMLAAALSFACAPHAALPADPPSDSPRPAATASPGLREIIEAALDDAARHTSVARPDLKVIGAEQVIWSDGSAGCPQPGMLYTQALVPGYRIRILAGGEELDYHANRQGHLLLCPPGRSLDPLPAGAR